MTACLLVYVHSCVCMCVYLVYVTEFMLSVCLFLYVHVCVLVCLCLCVRCMSVCILGVIVHACGVFVCV